MHRPDAPSVFLIYENVGPTGFSGLLMNQEDWVVYFRVIQEISLESAVWAAIERTMRFLSLRSVNPLVLN